MVKWPKLVSAVLALLLCGAAVAGDNPGPSADEVIARYLKAVQTDIGGNLRSLGRDGAIKRLHELGEEHLLKHKEILHKRAAAEYLKLEEMKPAAIEKLKRIVWETRDKYKKGQPINVGSPDKNDLALNKAAFFISMFVDGGYGIPPYGKETRATTWWDPLTAAKTLRPLALQTLLPEDEARKRLILDDLAPPAVFRLSSDAEAPSIAFADGKEIMVFDLTYTDVGIYALAGLRWVKCEE